MSPQYQILSQEPKVIDNKNGTLVKVRFIPIVNGIQNSERVEDQEYFVVDGDDIAKVLSRAAWNHEDTVKEQLAVTVADVPGPVKEALTKDKL